MLITAYGVCKRNCVRYKLVNKKEQFHILKATMQPAAIFSYYRHLNWMPIFMRRSKGLGI
jgi:hypothetical protein